MDSVLFSVVRFDVGGGVRARPCAALQGLFNTRSETFMDGYVHGS